MEPVTESKHGSDELTQKRIQTRTAARKKQAEPEKPAEPAKKPEEQIVKVKIRGTEDDFREIIIVYTVINANHDPVVCQLALAETPHPDFFTTLNSLLTLSMRFGGLDKTDWANGWVSGVSLKPDGELYAVNLTAQCYIEGLESPALSNSPYLSADVLDYHAQNAIEALVLQAQLYINGKRAQTQLGLEL